ncbi:hypothetical protein CEXT_487731 [Caerostris extrusa]|uniref:LAGLIDADG homing endonuclease n=1 Tax=Caerostris extrusa TaxID=172846 RepID=A0AAV4QBF0_CAEEX|nr:hypothetical protein CEXT_487731 [Caerostris extrusa]
MHVEILKHSSGGNLSEPKVLKSIAVLYPEFRKSGKSYSPTVQLNDCGVWFAHYLCWKGGYVDNGGEDILIALRRGWKWRVAKRSTSRNVFSGRKCFN